MNRHWYLSRAGQVFGPVNDAQLAEGVAMGRVLPTDSLNEAGQPHWLAAGTISWLFPPAALAPVVADLIEEQRTARVTCFGCFREVTIEFDPGTATAPCPKCRAAIETGEAADPAPAHQAAFAKLESPAAFKKRMQQKVAAAEGAAANEGAVIGGIIGGLIQ